MSCKEEFIELFKTHITRPGSEVILTVCGEANILIVFHLPLRPGAALNKNLKRSLTYA